MKEWDITEAMELSETPETRAYDHALDIALMVAAEMEEQGIGKKELAERMSMSLPQLSKLLNTQPNMTLETIARFELALNVELTLAFLSQTNKAASLTPEEQAQIVEILHYDTFMPSQSFTGYDENNTQVGTMTNKRLRFAA